MIIRDAREGDERVIAEINVRSWQAAYSHILPASLLENLSIDRREEGWREQLIAADRTILMAEENGNAVGWIALGEVRDPDCGTEVAELYGIYLDPDSWHRGVGRQLLDRGLERLPGDRIREVVLWIIEENHQARSFYESAGFALESESRKMIEIGGSGYPEVRYRYSMPEVVAGD